MVRPCFVMICALVLGASCALAQDAAVPVPGETHSFGDPRPVGAQATRAEPTAPAAPAPGEPPQPVQGSTPAKLDARAVALYSVLWILAIVLAMTAILRAEATDRYHDHTHGDLKTS